MEMRFYTCIFNIESIFFILDRYNVQVNKKYQRMGLGTRLLECAIDLARQCEIPFCRLTVFKVHYLSNVIS